MLLLPGDDVQEIPNDVIGKSSFKIQFSKN